MNSVQADGESSGFSTAVKQGWAVFDSSYDEMQAWFEEPFLGLLNRQPNLIETIKGIAGKLESLHEYNPRQALFVAADIVRCRFQHLLIPTDSTQKEIQS